MSKDRENIQLGNLINDGVDLAGGAIGGALGFLAGGPTTAAIWGAGGVIVSKTLSHIGEEISERLLGPRERTRIGATLAISAKEISERIKAGEKIRNDGFFDIKEEGRSDAEELAESVLLKSQREPEEKKIPLFSHLLSNITFSTEITVALGEQLIKATEQLTYRQLCILRLVGLKGNYKLRNKDYRDHSNFSRKLYQVLNECLDLYTKGFINNGASVALGMTDINPSELTVQGIGSDIHNWMQLWQIPEKDLEPLVKVLGE